MVKYDLGLQRLSEGKKETNKKNPKGMEKKKGFKAEDHTINRYSAGKTVT